MLETTRGTPFASGVEPPRCPRPTWPALAVVWGCVSLLLAVQTLTIIEPHVPDSIATWMFVQQFLRGAFWLMLTPLVFALSRSWPLHGPRRYAHLAGHLGVSLGLMLAFWAARVPVAFILTDETERLTDLHYVVAKLSLRNVVDLLLYWCTYAGARVVDLATLAARREAAESDLRARLARTELGALRQQVQPHFLFNALNAIGALVHFDRNHEAAQAIDRLSRLQRALLESSDVPAVPLAREIEFIESYLAIEQLRFGDRLRVDFQVDAAAREVPVPNLILQPLVENAIKHGAARRVAPCLITIAVIRRGDRLRCTVRNDAPDPGAPPSPGTGYGLRGTRERLARLHGDRAHLEFRDDGPGGVTTVLDFPCA